MTKNIWIFNHYATNMFFEKSGRHYCFAKYLKRDGYQAVVFCASTLHNSEKNIDTNKKKYQCDEVDNIPFVFVKTPLYNGNGFGRIRNMYAFYKNLFSVAKNYLKTHEKPDMILASSVHPLTLVAGIKIAKELKIPCICEVRDLWPESIFEYSSLKKTILLAKVLYTGEKWIYKKADKLIFTMEGGKDYITEKGWDKDIDLNKVFHINNGVDLETFNYNKEHYTFEDGDLEVTDSIKIIYTGSIRKANNIELIIKCAKLLSSNIVLIIYGDGAFKQTLINFCRDNEINNVFFKGHIHKKYIPYVVSKSNLNILNYDNASTWSYGGSQNKLFDYFASGKPILSNNKVGYCLINKYKCGISLDINTPEKYATEIFRIVNLKTNEYSEMCENSLKAAKDYDFRNLTKTLEEIINK